ncbi:hypothetical protein [Symmachiella dynata]|uniref:hypothetical protein n=1 Tax=Symmachiella dynata TaxID=2527995 RepID=UPI0030ED4BE1
MSTAHSASPFRIARRVLSVLKWGVVASLLALGVVSMAAYFRDADRLQQVAKQAVNEREPVSQQVVQLVDYVAHDVPRGRPEVYFLSPVFQALKPTACQVIDEGGDCAYKARAFIVLANQLGIESSKLCLHDASGEARHAVARVATERGDYIVDLLFGICYRNEDGTPMSIPYIAENLESIIAAEVDSGNELARKYPVQRYPFDDVSTINWKKSDFWKSAYSTLNVVMSEEQIAGLQRPYFSEEPALMVAYAAFGCCFMIVIIPPAIRRIWRWRKHRRDDVASTSTESKSTEGQVEVASE